jgi:hypothetical protein
MIHFFIILIALVVPLFFVFVYLMSARNHLKKARERCHEAESSCRAAHREEHPEAARGKWEAAAAEYEMARTAFPGKWFARLIGFAPAQLPPPADSPQGPKCVSEEKPER